MIHTALKYLFVISIVVSILSALFLIWLGQNADYQDKE